MPHSNNDFDLILYIIENAIILLVSLICDVFMAINLLFNGK